MKHLLILALAGTLCLAVLAGSSAAGPAAASCSASPNPASVDGSWTVSAAGLPSGGEVDMRTVFPDGAASTGPINVNRDGTFQATGTAWYGHQTGTYTYLFTSKVSFTGGDTWKKTFASCTVEVQ